MRSLYSKIIGRIYSVSNSKKCADGFRMNQILELPEEKCIKLTSAGD